MHRTITPFDTSARHIHTTVFVIHPQTGTRHSFDAILDTGAPWTEFSDVILSRTGFIDSTNNQVKIRQELQSQKYGKLVLPLNSRRENLLCF